MIFVMTIDKRRSYLVSQQIGFQRSYYQTKKAKVNYPVYLGLST